ncbi:hypothetical protein Tco_0506332 [Tanacetum coccineum]
MEVIDFMFFWSSPSQNPDSLIELEGTFEITYSNTIHVAKLASTCAELAVTKKATGICRTISSFAAA